MLEKGLYFNKLVNVWYLLANCFETKEELNKKLNHTPRNLKASLYGVEEIIICMCWLRDEVVRLNLIGVKLADLVDTKTYFLWFTEILFNV